MSGATRGWLCPGRAFPVPVEEVRFAHTLTLDLQTPKLQRMSLRCFKATVLVLRFCGGHIISGKYYALC